MERQQAVIIAIQGYPCTGKTTVAKELAKTLKCPLIHSDDILHALSPYAPPVGNVDDIFSRAFDVIIQFVKIQAALGFSIVIDSLDFNDSRRHDKQAALLMEFRKNSSSSLVFIELKTTGKSVWEGRWKRVQELLNGDNMWFKPSQWKDVCNMMRTDEAAAPLSWGSKLIVDTKYLIQTEVLVQAVRDLATSTGLEVQFKEWKLIHYEGPLLLKLRDPKRQDRTETSPKGFCSDGHCINLYMEDGIGHYAICAVCGDQVQSKSPVYTCRFCSLAVHKPCAELQEKMYFTPKNCPYGGEMMTSFSFLDEHLCPRCRLQGKEFSYDCASCIFHSHLKCRLVPTILNHEGHDEHKLFFWARPISVEKNQYLCAACTRLGQCAAYGCMEGCDINYHPVCALLPRWTMHQHGGHEHDMKLLFSCDLAEEEEEYFCDVCLEVREPEDWYYSCDECLFASHFWCIDLES